MSGPLVGLVNDHGPTDHSGWAILSVLAERLHGPLDSYDATNEELERLTRLSRSSVKRGVAFLVEDGWLGRVPGRFKGTASTYRLRLDAFPAEAVAEVLAMLQRGSQRTPLENPETDKGVHTEPLSDAKGVQIDAKGVHTEPPPVTRSDPSQGSGLADTPLEGVLATLSDVTDEEQRAVVAVLHHARHARLEPKPHVVRAIVAAIRAGHTVGGIKAHLDPPRINWDKAGPGLVVKAIRELAATPKAVPVDEARTDHPSNGEAPRGQAPDPVVAELAAVWTAEDEEDRRARHEALLAETRARVRSAGRVAR